MTVTIARDGKRYRLTTAEMLEASSISAAEDLQMKRYECN